MLPDEGAPRTVLSGGGTSEWWPLTTSSRLRVQAGLGADARTVSVVLSSLSGLEPAGARVVAQAIVSPPRG